MKKKLITMVCLFAMTFTTAIPVGAQTISKASEAQVPIQLTMDSTFVVTLPESVSGASGNTSATLPYKVNGDIASDKHITLAVTDEDSDTDGTQVALKDATNITKYATVTLPKTSFAYDEVKGVTQNGTISFEGLTAGTWNGIAKFQINLE